MSGHTPEPWTAELTNEGGWISGPDLSANVVCDIVTRDESEPATDEDHANARRIVAAVNACAGLSTDSLEAGVVAALVEALREAERFISSDYQSAGVVPGNWPTVTPFLHRLRAVLAQARPEPAK